MTPETLIQNELDRLGIYYRVQGENFVVTCLWHDDSKPSLSIHKSGSKARCWSCPWTGTWNSYASAVGGKGIDENEIDVFAQILNEHTKDFTDPKDPWGLNSLPNSARDKYTKPWRGISGEFLSVLDARKWYDDNASATRILFPIRDMKKVVGWVAAREDPKDETVHPKYLNMDKLPVWKLLYPINLLRGSAAIVVEGPFDAIRLCYHKLPAVAIFGTENWNMHKAHVLINKGIRKLFLALDGDEAGRRTANEIAKQTEDLFEEVVIIDLPDGQDPGDVDEDYIQWMRTLLSDN